VKIRIKKATWNQLGTTDFQMNLGQEAKGKLKEEEIRTMIKKNSSCVPYIKKCNERGTTIQTSSSVGVKRDEEGDQVKEVAKSLL